ncbi:MAG: TRAP transporter large permease [Pseudomonadota bacterium]
MTTLALSLALLGVIGLLIAGVPVAIAIGLSTTLYIMVGTQVPPIIIAQMMVSSADSFPLLAIPFFLLAGTLMNSAGITQRLFDFASCLVRHIPGGLGHVNVVASMIFAGMSGSAVADAAGLGVVEMKAMRKYGYDEAFSGAITAASSTIGPVIPPSIIFVIYGVLAEVSVGALFLAGIIPGVLMGLALMVQVYRISKKKNYPVLPRATLRELWDSFRGALLPLMTPVIIVGGMIAGIFTPTEASVVAVAYAFVLGVAVYRELTWSALWSALHTTAVQTAAVMFITAAAGVLGWALAQGRVPQQIADAVLSVTSEPWLVLLLINLLLLLVGCFMEVIAALLILTPILVPVIKSVGIDPLHFGVVMTLNLMIGLITPPMGMSLFVVQQVTGVPFDRLVRAVAPFLVALIAVLVIVTYVPSLSLALPRAVMGTG